MGIYKMNEITEMDESTLTQKLEELRNELNVEKGISKSGGKGGNSGKIREIKKTIARILTVLNKKGFDKVMAKIEEETKKSSVKKKGEKAKNE